jgi:hypothetical protein
MYINGFVLSTGFPGRFPIALFYIAFEESHSEIMIESPRDVGFSFQLAAPPAVAGIGGVEVSGDPG